MNSPMSMSAEERLVREVVAKWVRASATADVTTMLALLADDMQFLVPGQPPFGKEEFRAAWEGPMKGAKAECDAEVEEVLVSGDFACTRTRLTVAITTADGNRSRASGYAMTLFRKQPDGRWLFARDANLLTPE